MKLTDQKEELFLFKKMKEGNEYAFDFFFNYYYPGLCVYAQSIIKIPEDESRNLVQDVFLKFWNNREDLNIETSVRSYLFTSVKNKCLDYLRKNYRKPEIIDISNIQDLKANDFETYILSELETLLNTSLQKLPDRCRKIFELSRLEGLKNREIAEKLNISEKTVENQMTKAIRILKYELKDYLPLLLLFESFHILK